MTGKPARSARRAAALAAALTSVVLCAGVPAHAAPKPKPTPPVPSDSPRPTPTPTEPTPTPTPTPKPKPDTKAPGRPDVGSPTAGAGGRITVTIRAEKKSDVVVREQGGGVVASGKASGGSVTLSWTTSTGTHAYTARATDKAGNTSKPASFSAEADADPPPLGKATWTAGTAQDSRSRVQFRTADGTAYRVVVDGVEVLSGTAEEPAVERIVDVANGDHDVRVEAFDDIGNVASRERSFTVRIPTLAVKATRDSESTERTQVFAVSATPNATTGVVRRPGFKDKPFTLERGKATVKVPLRDGAYDEVSVVVRDSQQRKGVAKVPAFVVDTTAPVLSLSTNSKAAAGGKLDAVVRTEPGAKVTWTLSTSDGVTADSGSFTAEQRETTISRDADEGTYTLKVVVADDYGHEVSKTSELRIATDPWSIRRILLAGLAATVGGVALVFLVTWLLRTLGRTGAGVVGRRRERHRLEVADVARREHLAGAGAALDARSERSSVLTDFLYGVTAGWEVGDLPGFTPRPGETVRHMTVATAYESSGGGPASHVATLEGALVVTAQRLVLLGDGRHEREWPASDLTGVVHTGEDESVFHHTGDDERWTVISYGEPEMTRLHLDQLQAEQEGHGEQHLAARRAELERPADDAVDLTAWV